MSKVQTWWILHKTLRFSWNSEAKVQNMILTLFYDYKTVCTLLSRITHHERVNLEEMSWAQNIIIIIINVTSCKERFRCNTRFIWLRLITNWDMEWGFRIKFETIVIHYTSYTVIHPKSYVIRHTNNYRLFPSKIGLRIFLRFWNVRLIISEGLKEKCQETYFNHRRSILIQNSIQLFVDDPHIIISNEETCLQYFLEILKRMLQNFLKILKSCFLVSYAISVHYM